MSQIDVNAIADLQRKFSELKFVGGIRSCYDQGGQITHVKIEMTLKEDDVKCLTKILKEE